jgi:hypothetical protein
MRSVFTRAGLLRRGAGASQTPIQSILGRVVRTGEVNRSSSVLRARGFLGRNVNILS